MTWSYCACKRVVFVSAIDLGSRALGNAHARAVLLNLPADAGRLAVLGIGIGDIGEVDRRLLGDDAAFRLRRLLLVTLDHVDAAHERASLARTHLDHLAGATLVATGEHDDLVALADFCSHYRTSGASDMIFRWF